MEALTKSQARDLARCEKTIQSGLTTFFQVGQALWDIRDSKLYLGTHETFEAYCNERWDFSKSRVYQLIAAAEVSAAISTIVDTPPEREAHIRPLLSVDADDRAEVWRLAVDTAPRDDAGKPRLSKQHVEDTVAAWQAERQEEATPEPTRQIPDAIDVESRPVRIEDDVDEPDDWEEEEDDDQPEPEAAPSEDDEALQSIEDLVRDVFRGRLAVAAARLDTLAETLRSDC